MQRSIPLTELQEWQLHLLLAKQVEIEEANLASDTKLREQKIMERAALTAAFDGNTHLRFLEVMDWRVKTEAEMLEEANRLRQKISDLDDLIEGATEAGHNTELFFRERGTLEGKLLNLEHFTRVPVLMPEGASG